ncbi:Ubiquilin (Suppressor of NosA) [Durusdinium trenchii]
MLLRIKPSGAPEFEVDVEDGATLQDVKVAATAGCDIDPELMKIIYKGKVLKDEAALEGLGIQSGTTLHIAKGIAQPREAGYANVKSAESIEIQLKGPGLDISLAVGLNDAVEELRQLAASRCDLQQEEVHLLHKGKILKDGATLASDGIISGAVVRVARRSGPQQPSFEPVVPSTPEPAEGSAMPMAWGNNGPMDLAQVRMMATAMGIPLDQVLANMPHQQAMALAQQEMAQLRRAPANESTAEMQARWAREAADMARQVRAYLEREGEPEADNDELLVDISRTLAAARERGAPVPNAVVFVDRAVARRRQSLALQQRMDREIRSGLDPEIEDAFAAAEQSVSAAARAPRRLGGEPPPPGA